MLRGEPLDDSLCRYVDGGSAALERHPVDAAVPDLVPQGVGLVPVLRIHDILGWIRIRIRGSMLPTNGSGSWIRILLFSSLTFKMPAKKEFINTIFSAFYFLKLHLHNFFR